MSMETRKIFCWNPSRAPEALPPNVSMPQWDVHTSSDPQHAHELLYRYKFPVAVIRLDCCSDEIYGHVENLVLNSKVTQWVALINCRCLESNKLRQLLYSSFYDYHTLPDDPARLLITLGHAYGMSRLKDATVYSEDSIEVNSHKMVGVSPAMQALFAKISKVAQVDAPVLVTGESGTGKELSALSIHKHSSRASGPFVAVNCGALPANLIQSELFGHEKGAFTGAHQKKIGRIEAASGGTLFLDEIGDLPLDQQVNLLRFLEEKKIDRVGGTQPVSVNVRVIAATHKDLEYAVQEKDFREDLYYRLNVLHLHVPALREREGDVVPLAHFLFEKFTPEKSAQVKGFSHQALQIMSEHYWPGNVRELVNRVRSAMLMCEGKLISPEDLGLDRRSSRRQLMTLGEARAEADKESILTSLRSAQNNITRTSKQLNISRITLYRLMDKYGIFT